METLTNDKTYLLACSYGPDSMAVFHLLKVNNFPFEVAHVNYHMRGAESDLESLQLEEYCKKNSVKFHRLDVLGLEIKENFESAARKFRYDFFKQVASEIDGDVILLTGHNEDDVLETYLMQKKRQKYVSYYGIRQNSHYHGLDIYRPLITFPKQDLEELCKINNVPYAIDSSNLTLDYTRNIIRHTLVAKMDSAKRKAVIEEINKLNNELDERTKRLAKTFNNFEFLEISKLNSLTEEDLNHTVFNFFRNNECEDNFTGGWVKTVHDFITSNKPNIIEPVNESYHLVKEYENIYLLKLLDEIDDSYAYVLKEPGYLKTPEFELDFTLPPVRGAITSESYPLTIRNAGKGDTYEVDGNVKTLNRLFIDWKMPLRLRKRWPVFVDKNGIIVYVPRYRSDYQIANDTNLSVFLY